jgi:primosomal protein N' (replication factor Y)
VPPALEGRLAPGQRVRVPFRGRPRPAVVVALEGGGGEGLQALEDALDPVPALSPALLALARWAAAETASAWGEVVARALPKGVHAGAPASLPPASGAQPFGGATLVTGAHRAERIEHRVGAARAAGGVLVAVPEIEQARAWAARLEARLGEPVALVTSAVPARRRWAAWWALREGRRRVAVGTRMAAWLPVAPLALAVVVDEEDPAHKAPDSPRWHARELVIERARQEGGQVLLASPAPSLETWVRAREGLLGEDRLPPEGWPAVQRVRLEGTGAASGCLSPGLRDAARAALARGGAVALLLDRLGFARLLVCAECGAARRCERCRLALGYHRETRALVCRLCGRRQPASSLCGRCRGRHLLPLGWGTERAEAEARRVFPEARVVRYDSTLGPRALAAAGQAYRSGAARVVVGTHMALRLLEAAPVSVGALLLADTTLSVPDFRAAERTFQLAWRLAEAVRPDGQLWLQSFLPDHPALAAVAAGDPEPFYAAEWAERRELGYPPARRLARLVLEGRDGARWGADLAVRARAAGLTVLGPAVLAGARVQLVLLGDAALPAAVADMLAPLRGRRRIGATRLAVDIDPVELP